MKELIFKQYKDAIAFFLIVVCILLLALMDNMISDNLRQTLVYILIGCFGFLFRGGV